MQKYSIPRGDVRGRRSSVLTIHSQLAKKRQRAGILRDYIVPELIKQNGVIRSIPVRVQG